MEDADLQALSFEQALEKLEAIVAEIDRDDVGLEQAIKAYERGVQLRDHCERKLNEAQERISKIRVKDGGIETVSPSSDDSDSPPF